MPHRQFVFALPKALRIFFRHDRRLFGHVSRLIYRIIQEFYRQAAGRPIRTGVITAHQTFGDMLRWNPHFHSIVLEGGFDEQGTFVYIPLGHLETLTELLRRRVIALLVAHKLLDRRFARNMLSWRHSGFSVDNSVRILDRGVQRSLAEYISRPAISLKKIRYEPFKGRVLFHTTYSEYFKENVHLFDPLDFLAELTQHIPPARVQLIRRYGLYSSRIKGHWTRMPYVLQRAPSGWTSHNDDAAATASNRAESGVGSPTREVPATETDAPDARARRRAWARLRARVYEVDPLVCPRCGARLRVIAVIQNPVQITKILNHLVRTGRAPPGLDPTTLN